MESESQQSRANFGQTSKIRPIIESKTSLQEWVRHQNCVNKDADKSPVWCVECVSVSARSCSTPLRDATHLTCCSSFCKIIPNKSTGKFLGLSPHTTIPPLPKKRPQISYTHIFSSRRSIYHGGVLITVFCFSRTTVHVFRKKEVWFGFIWLVFKWNLANASRFFQEEGRGSQYYCEVR